MAFAFPFGGALLCFPPCHVLFTPALVGAAPLIFPALGVVPPHVLLMSVRLRSVPSGFVPVWLLPSRGPCRPFSASYLAFPRPIRFPVFHRFFLSPSTHRVSSVLAVGFCWVPYFLFSCSHSLVFLFRLFSMVHFSRLLRFLVRRIILLPKLPFR